MLGTVPDPELAERLGCTSTMVANRRGKPGVPAFGTAPARLPSRCQAADRTRERCIRRLQTRQKRPYALAIPAAEKTHAEN
jgi:hypothetical protein